MIFKQKSLSQKVRSAPFRKLQICVLRNEFFEDCNDM